MAYISTERPMRLKSRRYLWAWGVGGTVVAFAVWSFVPAFRAKEVLFGLVGAVWAVFYFIYQQYLEEAKFFRELFTAFNRRYDRMNSRLTALKAIAGNFDPTARQAFADYFNLCAEEWLFFQAGYIDERAWEAWTNGMRGYAEDARVRELWLEERKSNSYYGFEFPTS